MAATILHLPGFTADPARHGTRTGTVIALDMSRNIVLIGGTHYAGEIKKSVFSLLNFHAPLNGVFPMHCSANVGPDGRTALFFGLSGTGKTTLSSDPSRPLIGDDEHLWSGNGVANIEGGCYAKTARLSATAEPEIFAATKRFGTVIENVVIDEVSGEPDFDDLSLTENTGPGRLPLSLRLHRQSRRHRTRRHRADRDLLGLLRRSLYVTSPTRLWRSVRPQAR